MSCTDLLFVLNCLISDCDGWWQDWRRLRLAPSPWLTVDSDVCVSEPETQREREREREAPASSGSGPEEWSVPHNRANTQRWDTIKMPWWTWTHDHDNMPLYLCFFYIWVWGLDLVKEEDDVLNVQARCEVWVLESVMPGLDAGSRDTEYQRSAPFQDTLHSLSWLLLSSLPLYLFVAFHIKM